ncbi:MAG TPA: hypothetical protein VLL54_02250 [Pyrinomonadaceae bacterium]|nr:hypothetical protein [Pyrinomonadaceae bacterium]
MSDRESFVRRTVILHVRQNEGALALLPSSYWLSNQQDSSRGLASKHPRRTEETAKPALAGRAQLLRAPLWLDKNIYGKRLKSFAIFLLNGDSNVPRLAGLDIVNRSGLAKMGTTDDTAIVAVL